MSIKVKSWKNNICLIFDLNTRISGIYYRRKLFSSVIITQQLYNYGVPTERGGGSYYVFVDSIGLLFFFADGQDGWSFFGDVINVWHLKLLQSWQDFFSQIWHLIS